VTLRLSRQNPAAFKATGFDVDGRLFEVFDVDRKVLAVSGTISAGCGTISGGPWPRIHVYPSTTARFENCLHAHLRMLQQWAVG
jgi:hypothetical protein